MPDMESALPAGSSTVRRVFFGPSGLRAGWRLLIFVTILIPLLMADGMIIREFAPHLGSASRFILNQITRFLLCLLVSWILTEIEGGTLGEYGLPWRRMFRGQF